MKCASWAMGRHGPVKMAVPTGRHGTAKRPTGRAMPARHAGPPGRAGTARWPSIIHPTRGAPLWNWTGARTPPRRHRACRTHHKEGRWAGESEGEFRIGTKSPGALESGRMGRNETLLRRKRRSRSRSRLRWHGEPSERRRQLSCSAAPQCGS